MKKILALLLTLALTLSLFASCSGEATPAETAPATAAPETAVPATSAAETGEKPVRSVKSPMKERPNYVLTEDATPDEIRAMAVKAMRDGLTIVWYPERDVEYTFVSTSGEGFVWDFKLRSMTNYAGMPYTKAISGIMQFWEYYDPETGRVTVPQKDLINNTIGNQCAGGVIWGWASCVSSVRFRTTSTRTAPGVIQVGDFTYKDGTMQTCELNGEQKMYAAYAEVKPADFLASGTPGDNHVLMAVEAAHVVKTNGVIDGKESYILIQDQRGGARNNTGEYVKTEDGEQRHYSGRTGYRFTFEEFFKKGYLPYTCAEFLGLKPYTMPGVELDREVNSFDDLAAATLSSNYFLCVFYINVRDVQGNTVFSRTHITDYADMNAERLTAYPLSELQINQRTLSRNATRKGDVVVEITCVDATGSEFSVASFETTI